MPNAWALTITPLTDPRWSGSDPKNPDASDVAGIVGSGPLTQLYKKEVDSGVEEGPYASYYDTTFYNSPTEPEEAEIKWVGSGTDPFISSDPLYLLVKDGNNDPIWYIFDLFTNRWDGKDTIYLDNFWPNNGGISHVTIFGNPTPVPEPATMVLFGTGLIGLAGIGRRKLKSN